MMLYLTTSIISAVCLILFIYVWRLEGSGKIVFTPFVVLMINEFFRVMPAYVWMPLEWLSDSYPILVFFCGYVALVSGFFLSLNMVGYAPKMPQEFKRQSITLGNEKIYFIAIILIGLLLCACGIYLYRGLPSVVEAFKAIISGDDISDVALAIRQDRIAITKGHYFGAQYRGQGVFRVLMFSGWPFLVGTALAIYLKKGRKLWLIMTIVLVSLSFLFVAGDGTRGNFLKTLIIYIILYSYVRRITVRFILGTSGVFFLFFLITSIYSPKMAHLVGREDFLYEAVEKIVQRITIGNSINDIYAIELIRSGVIDYHMGAVHFRDLKAAFPGIGGGLPFSHELYMILNPFSKNTTYQTGTYISKVFVDFGIIGVGLIYLLLGFILGVAQKWIFAVEKTVLNLVLVSFLTFTIGSLVLGSGLISTTVSAGVVLSIYALMRGSIHFLRKTLPPRPHGTNIKVST